MRFGHVTGTKKEKPGASAWYKAEEERRIQAVEKAWARTSVVKAGTGPQVTIPQA